MKPIHFVLGIVALIMLGYTSATAQETDWQIFGNAGQLKEGEKYGLRSLNEKDFIHYGERKYGINLKWIGSNPLNINFKKESGAGTTIKTGERIAIMVEKGGYLKYKKRKWGINLVWSATPVYEWEIRSQNNKDGEDISVISGNNSSGEGGQSVALYQSTTKDFIKGCKRPEPTINLAWASDCYKRWRSPTAAELKKIADLAKKTATFL